MKHVYFMHKYIYKNIEIIQKLKYSKILRSDFNIHNINMFY